MKNRLLLVLLILLSGCYPREEPVPEPETENPEDDRRPGHTIIIDTTTNEIITDTIYIEL
ncbi:hypothetical protein [Barnesiella sp. An22]|uniref:hypothetical protein n=1 Tax=Barnesiella sp. An22 TaxID=1965590 RepID=UPI00320AD86B